MKGGRAERVAACILVDGTCNVKKNMSYKQLHMTAQCVGANQNILEEYRYANEKLYRRVDYQRVLTRFMYVGVYFGDYPTTIQVHNIILDNIRLTPKYP